MGRIWDVVAVMNVFHIVNEKHIVNPVKAFCGKELDRVNGDYVWADQVQYDLIHVEGEHCPACLDSADYALYLLGSAGDGEEPRNVWQGVTTGRLQSNRPNFVNVPRGITKQEVRRIAEEIQDNVSQTILSPTDYAALERRLLKK